MSALVTRLSEALGTSDVRVRFEDRSKRMSNRSGPRWTAYVHILNDAYGAAGSGDTKCEAIQNALRSVDEPWQPKWIRGAADKLTCSTR